MKKRDRADNYRPGSNNLRWLKSFPFLGKTDILAEITRIILLAFFALRFLVDGLSYPDFNFFWYIVFSCLTVVWIIRNRCLVRLENEEIVLLGFITICFLSGSFSPIKEIRWEFPLQIFASWLLFFLIFRSLRPEDDEKLWWVLIAAGAAVILYGLHQHFWGLEQTRQEIAARPGLLESLPPTFLHRLESKRVFATFFYPNVLATFLLMLFPLVFKGLYQAKGTAIFCSVLLFLLTWTLFLSGSVGGFLVLLFLLQISLLAITIKEHFWTAWLILLLAEVGFLIFGYHQGHLPHISSLRDRLGYWQATSQIFQYRPWLGVGPGQFRYFYLRFKAPGGMEAKHAHSIFFETLAEEGLVGTIVFFAFLGMLLWKNFRLPRHQVSLTVALGLGLVAGLMHFLIDVSFIDESVSSLFFLLGAWGLARNKPESQPPLRIHSEASEKVLTRFCSCLIILLVLAMALLKVRCSLVNAYIKHADEASYLEERVNYLQTASYLYPRGDLYAIQGDTWAFAAALSGDVTYWKKAEESYQISLSLNPYSAVVWRKLAQLYLKQKRYEESLKMYLKCVENYPTKKQYQLEIALLYQIMGDQEKYRYHFSLAEHLPAVTKEEDNYVQGLLNGQDRFDRDTPSR
ncbi:MAG: O-antigen ligase family protein [Candidatus Omnitrophica bacterium]|nr:O-antigen ligase family protein [Candidatus Omnitrophota bacterium]